MNNKTELERRPAISLLKSGGVPATEKGRKLLSAIKAGLEEESVPWQEMDEKGDLSASELARRGARWSQLGVGIGIDDDFNMAVYFNRADNSQPLFTVAGHRISEPAARLMGTNAARLVKKIPFKELSLLTVS